MRANTILSVILAQICHQAFAYVYKDDVHDMNRTTDRQLMQLYREREELKQFSCDFGEGTTINFCKWAIQGNQHVNVRWKVGQGALSHWSGGPNEDHTSKDASGGYAYFETSFNKKNLPKGRGLTLQFLSAVIDNITQSDFTGIVNNMSKSDMPMKEQRIGGILNRVTNFKQSLRQQISQNINSKLTSIQNSLQAQTQLVLDAMPQTLRPAVPKVATLFSTKIPATKPQGHCIQFFYTVYGLSAEMLSVFVEEVTTGKRKRLWESYFDSQEKWMKMEISYAIPAEHQIVIEGRARDFAEVEREYRGYIAIDDFNFFPLGLEACYGHCTFDGGFCQWTQDKEDHFDWKLAKGSDNLYTGPSQDYNSFAKDFPPGNFLYIDADYPRRFGDKAILVSPQFPPTEPENGMCMKFAYHMFGNGIGNLTILKRTHKGFQRIDKVLWTLSGEAGNEWHAAQVPISSSEPYFVILEATIGQNSLGNIAVDNINFHHEFCPTFPEYATVKKGDCTFEENMCHWNNIQSSRRMDDFDWVRYPYGLEAGQHYTKRGSTINNSTSPGFYLTLNGDMLRPDRAGLNAIMFSPVLAANQLQCMSFHYFMYQSMAKNQKRPSLGGLRISLRNEDGTARDESEYIWRLNNHQSNKWRTARVPLGNFIGSKKRIPPNQPYTVGFEGIWANSKTGMIAVDDISFVLGDCAMAPSNAETIFAECSFDKSLCGWSNYVVNYEDDKSSQGTNWELILPTTSHKTDYTLKDHTFDIPVGFVSFNVFHPGAYQKSILLSPTLSNEHSSNITERCISFWFTTFPGKDNLRSQKALQIFQAVLYPRQGMVSAKSLLLWKLHDGQMKTGEWIYGQVTFTNEIRYRLLVKAEAYDGGFGLDDVTFYDGPCQTRPYVAHVEKEMQLVQF